MGTTLIYMIEFSKLRELMGFSNRDNHQRDTMFTLLFLGFSNSLSEFRINYLSISQVRHENIGDVI